MPNTEVVIEYSEVDALRDELELARVEASDLAGELRAARAALEAAEAVNRSMSDDYHSMEAEIGELQAKLDAQTQSYQQARAMWPEGYSHAAWSEMVRVGWERGDTYRARALALHKLVRRWKPEAWRLIDEKLDAQTDAIAARAEAALRVQDAALRAKDAEALRAIVDLALTQKKAYAEMARAMTDEPDDDKVILAGQAYDAAWDAFDDALAALAPASGAPVTGRE